MRCKLFLSRDSIVTLFGCSDIKDIVYLLNKKELSVDYLLTCTHEDEREVATLVKYTQNSLHDDELIALIVVSKSFHEAISLIEQSNYYSCIDPTYTEPEQLLNPESDPVIVSLKFTTNRDSKDYIPVNLGRLPDKGEQGSLRIALEEGDVDFVSRIMSRDEFTVDMNLVKEVVDGAENFPINSLEVFLGHVLFKLEDPELTKMLVDMLQRKAKRVKGDVGLILEEKLVYATAKLTSMGVVELDRLKALINTFLESTECEESRAFVIYEVVAIMGGDALEMLKDIVNTYGRYIPYTEESSPLIFGDIGMLLFKEWAEHVDNDLSEGDDPERREIAVVLLEKAVFSIKELLRLGNTDSFSINLSNFFAYMSALIPLLSYEMENSPSEYIRERREKDIVQVLCLAIGLLLSFHKEINVETLTEYFATEETADMVIDTTYENFIAVMESFFDTEINPVCEEIWEHIVSDSGEPSLIVQGALEVRKLVCPQG